MVPSVKSMVPSEELHVFSVITDRHYQTRKIDKSNQTHEIFCPTNNTYHHHLYYPEMMLIPTLTKPKIVSSMRAGTTMQQNSTQGVTEWLWRGLRHIFWN